MTVDLQSSLEILLSLSAVLGMFYKVVSTLNTQNLKIEELSREIKALEVYEQELATTKKELIELKYSIQALHSNIQSIEEAMKELKQDKKLLFEIISNMTKQQ